MTDVDGRPTRVPAYGGLGRARGQTEYGGAARTREGDRAGRLESENGLAE